MSKCKGLDCCRGIRGPLTEGNAVMIMHRPPCYAYTVYLSLSLGQLALTPLHAASFHLRPTPPVRVEQQPPRTLRARSVTHPLIHTDNRFWQASPQFALARSLARSPAHIVSPVSPRGWKKVARFLLHCSSKLPSRTRFIATHKRFREFTGQLFSPQLYGKRVPLKKKRKKKGKKKGGCVIRT